jgi:hypothetical protein
LQDLKKILVYILLVAFITPMALRAGAIGYYYANKTYIASQLCVNKDKPKSCCEGTCYLNKQLKKAEESQDNKLPAYLKSIEKDMFNHELISELKSVCFSKISTKHKPYNNSYNFAHQASIFQPPAIV